MTPKSDSFFTSDGNPKRAGLQPVEEPLAEKPIGVRLYAKDFERLADVPDRSGFVRDAVREKFERDE